MRKILVLLLLAGGWFAAAPAVPAGRPGKPEMQGVLEFLSSDAMEGRAPGTRGGELAESYVRSLFQLLGLAPLAGGDYYQPFTMTGFTTSGLSMRMGPTALRYWDDFIGCGTVEGPEFTVSGETVFVGFGIRAADFNWDDFKGTDLRGKFLVVRVNDPGHFKPELFTGKSMTYYGRWTCKLEEAARQGAAGVLLIHNADTAGYDWDVARNSWAGERLFLPDSAAVRIPYQGWLAEAALRRQLAAGGQDLDKLYQQSLTRDFRPVPLGLRVVVSGRNQCRTVIARNVIAGIPGRTDDRIVVSAHLDHLGRISSRGREGIFNGAVDNASAVTALIQLARILRNRPEPLRHTVVFLVCNAEESGLLGSQYFVDHAGGGPIEANLNLEFTSVWEACPAFACIGARHTTMEERLPGILKQEGLAYGHTPLEDEGFFYRSDQFSFARRGIPGIWVGPGLSGPGEPDRLHEYLERTYHTTRDKFDPDWPLDGLAQTVRVTLRLLETIDADVEPPALKTPVPFPVEPLRQ